MRPTEEQTLRAYEEYVRARNKRKLKEKRNNPPPKEEKKPPRRMNHPHQTNIERPW